MGGLQQPRVIGRYAIYGKIAAGGMATVHFGRLLGAVGFARTVAIKRLHPHLVEEPEFLSTMIDEARLVARIHHPNVVPTLDVVAAEGELLVVMEYVRGESLSKLLREETARGRRVPLPIASAIAIGALHGLHAAHVATSDRGEPLGIVHRDVSPQNILVGVDGAARVIDFGIAKAAGRLQSTGEGVVKGKIAYMAPEQLVNAHEVTCRADVYAMAVILWEMLAGRRLLLGDTNAMLFGQALAGVSEPPSRHASNLPRELDALVMKGLALIPDDRFASALEMGELLRRIVPPAFPTEVGAWAQDVASATIAQRGAALAEIESNSGMVNLTDLANLPKRPSSDDLIDDPDVPIHEDTSTEDAPTVAASSHSLQGPGHRAGGAVWHSRRAVTATFVTLGVLAVGIGGAVGLRGSTAPGAAYVPPASAGVHPPTQSTPSPSAPIVSTTPTASVAPPGSDPETPAGAASSSSPAQTAAMPPRPSPPWRPPPPKKASAPPSPPPPPTPAFDPASVR